VSLTLDFQTLEIQALDGAEQITHTQGSTTTTVADALGMELTRDEVYSSNGFWDFTDRAWWLPVSEMGSVVPREGDTITDAASVAYSVVSVQTLVQKSYYRCKSKKQR